MDKQEKLRDLIKKGLNTSETIFEVKNLETGVETEVTGAVIAGFTDETKYEIAPKKATKSEKKPAKKADK